MRKIQRITIAMGMLFILTGCSNYAKEYDKNTLVVKGNDSLVEISVEDFKDSSVSAENLTSYVEEQITTYNTEAGKKMVQQKSIDTEDMSKVKLVLSYKDIDSYNGFNVLDCVLCDYTEAEDSLLKGSFSSADGESVKAANMENTEKAKLLAISEQTDVVINGDILYYNKEVKVKDGLASTSGKGMAVIIYR